MVGRYKYEKDVMRAKVPLRSAKEMPPSRRPLYESSSRITINVRDRPVKLARTGALRVTGFHGCLESAALVVNSGL